MGILFKIQAYKIKSFLPSVIEASLVAQMVKNLHCRRCRFDPWVGKIPWRRAWQPTPGFLPGEFHGRRNLAGYRPQGPALPAWRPSWALGTVWHLPRKERGAHRHLMQYVIYKNILRKSEHLHAFYMHGEGNGSPLQDSCLENPMGRVGWWAPVHGVAKGRTRLSDFTFTSFTLGKIKVV